MKSAIQKILVVGAGFAALLLTGLGGAGEKGPAHLLDHWDDPYDCLGCHQERHQDWSTAQMSRAYTGDFFQAQYFKYAVRDSRRDEKMRGLDADCVGCHSPSAFLSGQVPPPKSARPDNYWIKLDPPPVKKGADRGVFCDFCHSIQGFTGSDPFNHNYRPDAGPGRNAKRADLEHSWAPYHPTRVTELFETAELCGICHNEQNTAGVWVKATHREWSETMYADRGIVCQICHMPPREGKPAKMGPMRDWNHRHWFGGGLTEFVEGAARIKINLEQNQVEAGGSVPFTITVSDIATGHRFPTGATEERDVWLHVGVLDAEGKEIQHIQVPPSPDDPNDRYFTTCDRPEAHPSHSSYGEPISRDSLPEGDRIYQDVFLDSAGKPTFGQWYAVEIVGNRLSPEETRVENYTWAVPADMTGKQVRLRASLWYRRMADSHAELLGIKKRPHLLVSRDEKTVQVR
jgi:hypothetical protein